MKTYLSKLFVLTIVALIAIPVAGSNQQLSKKARELAQFNKSQEILNVAAGIGGDVSDVKIKHEQRGKILKLTGSVPGSNDLTRVLLAVESVGQFKDVRNFIRVVPPKADDGIVVRKVTYVPAEHPANIPCPVCDGDGKKCGKLFKEWKDVNKRISKYVVRQYDKESTVYKTSSRSLIKQLYAVQDKLDASLCFRHKIVQKSPIGEGKYR